MTVEKRIFINGKKYLLFRSFKHKSKVDLQIKMFKKRLIKYRVVKIKDKRPYKLYYRDVIN